MSPKPIVTPRVPPRTPEEFINEDDRSPLPVSVPDLQHASVPAREQASPPAVETVSAPEPSPERVKKTIHFPPELHRRLKVYCVETGAQVSDVVAQAVEAWLQQAPKK